MLDGLIESGKAHIRAAMREAVQTRNYETVWMLVRRNQGYKILRGDIAVTLKAPTLDDIAAQQAKAA